MNLTTARALAAGFTGGKPFEPANDVGLVFHITIKLFDNTLIGKSGRYVDSIAAQQAGEEIGGLGCKVTVRPDIETSYLHGRLRYPNAPHKMASPEAVDGWVTAANADKVRRALTANERGAMVLQRRQADVDAVIAGRV